jgi:hypothetical protein
MTDVENFENVARRSEHFKFGIAIVAGRFHLACGVKMQGLTTWRKAIMQR